MENASAGLILYYHAQTTSFVVVTLGAFDALSSISTWGGQQFAHHAIQGPASQLTPDRAYELKVHVDGSRVSVDLDGVNVIASDLPYPLPRGQAGIWATGPREIRFHQFEVTPKKPKIFVVMQFTPPFNELYTDVIVPVCEQEGFEVVRADETFGPGIIIADIARQITEATVIVADITPNNPNVYWEVGYAHALQKPTVLIAERETQLPFDVSPFRTLFYDNTIAGKSKIEDGLRSHLAAIQLQYPF